MIQNVERRKFYNKWRLELLEDMKRYLGLYKVFKDKSALEMAQKCGKVTEMLKQRLEGMK